MAVPTYHASAHVLRKTKLGESDLIITLLAEDGSLLRAVAKGARKPGNTFASRLELFSRADLLLAEGKNLDIISEVRLVDAHAGLRADAVRAAAASCAVELFALLAQEDLENDRFSACLEAFLATVERAPEQAIPLLLAAVLLKAVAVAGFAPTVDACILCARPIPADDASLVAYSHGEGGPVCDACPAPSDAIRVPVSLLRWVSALLHTPFSRIATLEGDANRDVELLRFADSFIRVHPGAHLKSLTFFLTVSMALIFPCETLADGVK